MKRFKLSKRDRFPLGVCGGVADYLQQGRGLDYRILLCLLFLFNPALTYTLYMTLLIIGVWNLNKN